MTYIGSNLMFLIARHRRPDVHSLFVEVLGASTHGPSRDLVFYRLDDGTNVGVCYVAATEALCERLQRKGAWIEFLVDDPALINEQLAAIGVTQIDYHDRRQAYYQVPGGPVFRLAPLAA